MYFEIKILEESWVSLQYTLQHTLQPKCVTFRCAKLVFGAIQLKVQGGPQNITLYRDGFNFKCDLTFKEVHVRLTFT